MIKADVYRLASLFKVDFIPKCGLITPKVVVAQKRRSQLPWKAEHCGYPGAGLGGVAGAVCPEDRGWAKPGLGVRS